MFWSWLECSANVFANRKWNVSNPLYHNQLIYHVWLVVMKHQLKHVPWESKGLLHLTFMAMIVTTRLGYRIDFFLEYLSANTAKKVKSGPLIFRSNHGVTTRGPP